MSDDGKVLDPSLNDEATQGQTDPSTSGSNSEPKASVDPTNDGGYSTDGRNLERERQKMSKLMQENESLRRKQANLTNFIKQDPRVLREALIRTGGMSPAEAEGVVRQYYPQQQPNIPQQGYVPPVSPLSPSQQAALARIEQEEMSKEMEINKAVADFKTKHPEAVADQMDAQAIMYEAIRLYEKNKMPPAEALEQARRRILDPDSLREEGEWEGMGKALSGVRASSGSGGSANRSTQPRMTAIDAQVAKALGLKGEEQVKFQELLAE